MSILFLQIWLQFLFTRLLYVIYLLEDTVCLYHMNVLHILENTTGELLV